MIRTLLASSAVLAGAVVLGGCAGTGAAASPPAGSRGLPENACRAEAAQAFVGRTANGETGAAMLKASGAGVLRWVPPRTAVTMMYMTGRLTVSYDDDMKITQVSCN